MSADGSPAGIPTKLGHVALRVRDLDSAIAFYSEVLGLSVRGRFEGVAFLGIRDDASHELALFRVPADTPPASGDRAGLYHIAWEMASIDELRALHARLLARGANIVGYSDRQSNVMFTDPDGNELEAVWEPHPADLARAKAEGRTIPTPSLNPSTN